MITGMRDFFDPIEPAQIEWHQHAPRSLSYGDGYFGRDDGLAEAQCVFIEGNDLIQRFAQLQSNEVFVIGETGFGTGLNVLLAAQAFAQSAPKDARLHIVSVDLHPLRPKDLRYATEAWPSLKHWAERLVQQYPPAAPGHHRLSLANNIELTLMWGDASACFAASTASVNAWFLDGFAPVQNPAMWSQALFQTLFLRSASGATLASFTAAGHVRRGLAEAGFVVEKVEGFAGKRHRIIGHKKGLIERRFLRQGHALIAGAGLAGATTARALAERGWVVTVCDPNPPASGASGNLAGVVYATPSPHLQAQNRFYLSALIRALAWFKWLGFPKDPSQGRLDDVLLHLKQARRKKNAHDAHDSGAWPNELLSIVDNETACLHGAGYICPKAWVHHLLDHPHIQYQARTIESVKDMEADACVLANAQAALAFSPLETLPLKAIRGQVTEVKATPASMQWTQAHCHVGYLTPAMDGRHCVGATYDLHGQHPGTVDSDDEHNLDQLKAHLPQHWSELGGEHLTISGQRAAFRCTTPDRLPIVGPADAVAPNGWINIGHGSRGITHTPLCADLLADFICQTDTMAGLGVDLNIAQALSLERYLKKADA